MKLCKKIFRIATLAFIILVLVSGTVLAAYSYYATIQVQETGDNSYSYLPIIADIDNDYLADNGYMSLTGLDTRVLSGSTELEHLVADDKTLFIAPSVEASSTGNYKYTLGNSLLSSFPIITGYDGYVTILDDDDLELGDDFEIEWKGYIDTSDVANKNLIYKEYAFRTYISAEDEITAAIDDGTNFPTIAAVNGGNNATNNTNHTVNLPAGIVEDNLLIVIFSCDTNATITFPNEGVDWIQLFETPHTTDVNFGAWYRIADGGEGATITVTTSTSEMSAHTSYRITDYSGVPEVETATTGTDNPDPPSLTPTWGARNTLWLAICGYEENETTSAYPTNYTDGRNDYANDIEGCGVGSARRKLNAVSENPIAFTTTGAPNWVANTIAISPLEFNNNASVTAAGVADSTYTVRVTYDGADLKLFVDDMVTPVDTDAWVGSVPDNSNNWYLNQNNVMPYMEYYKHTVSDTLIAWYQPISMIVGTNLDDREGTDLGETGTGEEDGVITWGANPAGLSAVVGSLISSSQPLISPAGDEEAPDIVPEGSVPVTGGVVNTSNLQDNPLYPIVKVAHDYTGFTEEQIWFAGATFFLLIGMGLAAVKVPNHLLLAGTVGLVLAGFFMAMEIYQWWMMLIFGFMFIMSILMERKPVL